VQHISLNTQGNLVLDCFSEQNKKENYHLLSNNSSTSLHHTLLIRNSSINEKIEWRKGEVIGIGATGKVYQGLNLQNGNMMAVKKMRLPKPNDPLHESTIRRIEMEIGLMKQLHHPNVVEYLGVRESGSHLYIFLEYMAGGSLSSIIKKFGGKLPEVIIQRYLYQILSGLVYLHDNNVIHRDIKGAVRK
jgi:serine/threonine protein kinase